MVSSGIFDVFNGDADGLIARHQYRLKYPALSTLITGVKRDINLLNQLVNPAQAGAGDEIFVFDISYDANRDAAGILLDRGVQITWFDHHRADHLRHHPQLKTHINTDASTCTSLIVDSLLDGAYRHWAIAAAFGDNLHTQAKLLASTAQLSDTQCAVLQQLGEVINYNAYGDTVTDLLVMPTDLAALLATYASPFDFMAEVALFGILVDGFNDDITRLSALQAEYTDARVAAYILPDADWARRVSGTFANRCSRDFPDRAHIIATHKAADTCIVSIRAPANQPVGADLIAAHFGGGGRKSAAGINALPVAMLGKLIAVVRETYGVSRQR